MSSRKRKKEREEKAVVLDYLSHGHVNKSSSGTPIIQVVGKKQFTLLELVPKEETSFELLEELYIGSDDRPKIKHVKKRVSYNDLTTTAKGELKHAVKQIVQDKEKEYVDFFNNAKPLSTRTHLLQMLPGIGKKNMQQIVKERRIKDFESFDDLKNRVRSMKKPAELVTKRILSELEGNEKNFLFVKR